MQVICYWPCHALCSKIKIIKKSFCLHVCGLSHFEDLIRFLKSFSVYPAEKSQKLEHATTCPQMERGLKCHFGGSF